MAGGTATAGSDFRAASGKLVFAPGVVQKTINVQVIGDRKVEGNEALYVQLLAASGLAISKSMGVGTIIDNDGSSDQAALAFAAQSTSGSNNSSNTPQSVASVQQTSTPTVSQQQPTNSSSNSSASSSSGSSSLVGPRLGSVNPTLNDQALLEILRQG